MGLFVDIEALSARQTEMALGFIYKAIGDGHDDEDLWLEHPNPAIRRLVELFTQRGLMRMDTFRTELVAWLEGKRHTHGGTTMPRPPGAMERWTPEQVGLVKLYLETLPTDQWTLDDYQMVVDFLVQRYMSPDDMRSEAEWLATRSTLMGKVQANYAALTAPQADTVMAALPLTVAGARSLFSPDRITSFMLNFATNRAAESVRMVSEDLRHRMRGVVARHVEQGVLRIPGVPGQSLQTELLDQFGILNRDWRRIAVTEATEAAGQGYIAAMPDGAKVQRVEQYRGRCAFCARIDGKVFEVVDPSDPDKDGETQVWVGKTNVGRSAAPRKRMGDILVDREPHERWWPAAGVQHPHCRGSWLPMAADRPGDDPEFGAWLRHHLTPPKEAAHV